MNLLPLISEGERRHLWRSLGLSPWRGASRGVNAVLAALRPERGVVYLCEADHQTMLGYAEVLQKINGSGAQVGAQRAPILRDLWQLLSGYVAGQENALFKRLEEADHPHPQVKWVKEDHRALLQDIEELELRLTEEMGWGYTIDRFVQRLRQHMQAEANILPMVLAHPGASGSQLMAAYMAERERAIEKAAGHKPELEGEAWAQSTEDDTEAEALDELTKEELYERAQELRIGGRSKMSKRELIGAIRRAEP